MIFYFHNFLLPKSIFKKKIPFRSFDYKNRSEETRRVVHFFYFRDNFIGKAMGINPYDQPAVELIKKRDKKFLLIKIS